MLDFVHLHNHTHYSLLDAACTSEQLIKATCWWTKSFILTDHGVMYGCYEFYKKCNSYGIKPVIGFEAYIALGSRFDKSMDKSARSKKK